MSDNLKTVQAMYEAFGRGDVPSILERLDDDVVWEEGGLDHGVPWLRRRRPRRRVQASRRHHQHVLAAGD
jgi:uncharacterized protein